MNKFNSLQKILICPYCKKSLVKINSKLKCTHCNSTFNVNKYGYFDFILDKKTYTGHDFYYDRAALVQEHSGSRMYNEYLKPFQLREPAERILDVGCGIGKIITSAIKDGYDAYGIDLPTVSRYWSLRGIDPNRFFHCNATELPFKDNFFDIVYSLGVIEHIGTFHGHCTLQNNYREIRQQYSNEILRVTKPNGRIIIACPNKSFPIDIQHAVRDQHSPKTLGFKTRAYIHKKTGMNIHPIWGKYHLLSYSEIKQLFCVKGGAQFCKKMTLQNYFNFDRIDIDGYKRFLVPFIRILQFYVNYLCKNLPPNFLNPYTIVQIRKSIR